MDRLQATLDQLFTSCPELCGFSLQHETEGELCVWDVQTLPYARRDRVIGQIAVALTELLDEAPETRALLAGRTFARTLH